jgi:hypothetical protein
MHLTTRDLTPAQRSLLRIMHEHQFGRIENLTVQAGQPRFDCGAKVVRVSRLGGGKEEANPRDSDEFELKEATRDLLDNLARLENGIVLRLEFRHGLPCLLETAASLSAPNT